MAEVRRVVSDSRPEQLKNREIRQDTQAFPFEQPQSISQQLASDRGGMKPTSQKHLRAVY